MIPTSIATISDLRFKTKAVLAKTTKEPVVIFHRSKPRGVIMSVADYEEMLSLAEDYYLSLRAQEYEQEDKGKVAWISGKEMSKHLKTD